MLRPAAETTIDTAILDLDGTLADSGEIFTRTVEEVLKRKERFSDEEIERMRNASAKENMQILGVKKWQLPRLVIAGKRRIAERMGEVEVFDGIPEAVSELQDSHATYISSTNSREGIMDVLERGGIDIPSSHIYAGSGIFKKAKRLSTLLRKEGLVPAQCVYVGDEIRDIEAARQVGMQCVAVGWGYTLPAALLRHSPDGFAATPGDLVNTIRSLT